MGNIKKYTKRILSILVVLAILINMLPNFSLLFNTYATEEKKGIVIRKGTYDEENKVFSTEIYVKNLDITALTIEFLYPSDITETISYAMYSARKYIFNR